MDNNNISFLFVRSDNPVGRENRTVLSDKTTTASAAAAADESNNIIQIRFGSSARVNHKFFSDDNQVEYCTLKLYTTEILNYSKCNIERRKKKVFG